MFAWQPSYIRPRFTCHNNRTTAVPLCENHCSGRRENARQGWIAPDSVSGLSQLVISCYGSQTSLPSGRWPHSCCRERAAPADHAMSSWPHDIPRRISLSHRSSAEVPPFVLPLWRSLNPGFTVALYNDSECRAHVARFGDSRLLAAFDAARSGPIRSDLWRVLHLFRHGGVYVDSDVQPVAALREFVGSQDAFVTSHSIYGGVNPHFIVARPFEQLLNRTLQAMVTAVARDGGVWRGRGSYRRWSVMPAMNLALNESLGGHHQLFANRGLHQPATYAIGGGRLFRFLFERAVEMRDGMREMATLHSDGGTNASRLVLFNKWNQSVWKKGIVHTATQGGAQFLGLTEGGFLALAPHSRGGYSV